MLATAFEKLSFMNKLKILHYVQILISQPTLSVESFSARLGPKLLVQSLLELASSGRARSFCLLRRVLPCSAQATGTRNADTLLTSPVRRCSDREMLPRVSTMRTKTEYYQARSSKQCITSLPTDSATTGLRIILGDSKATQKCLLQM